ncbi:MAG: hypothetical protein E2O84_02440 [Bacteroidetes bacterium]|nr:MAG: hypothetical protein E2O84_02440 [Bacteroidota bacterium]
MRPAIICLFALVFIASTPASYQQAFGQNDPDSLLSSDKLMLDVLDLNDPVLSIWPTINNVEIESLSAAVVNLTGAYEANRLDADERTRQIQAMVAVAKRNEEKIKTMIKAAKKADDDEEKDRLEDLKDVYELRRKYLQRVSKVRDGERQLAETRIDYVNQLTYFLEIAEQLVAARESGNSTDLLGTERELIRQSKELGGRSSAVAGRLKKVNSEREKAFKDREKLIAAYN